MNGNYTVSTSLGGAKYLHDGNGLTLAVFTKDTGDAAFEAVKAEIARAGGTLRNADTGNIDVGTLDQLLA